ncbi:MAG TPA: zinc-dependent metalloprotease [Candidatus Xenobia bacterium]|nr:zinc-dependent metalloprotease [Candidatus Xenobia bacterium]
MLARRSLLTLVLAVVAALAVASVSMVPTVSGQEGTKSRDILFGQGAPKAEEKKPEPKKDEEKPFDEVVKDMEKIEGLFTFYRNAEENKVLLELRPDQFDKDYIYSSKTEQALGERGLYGTIMMDEFVFQWRRLGKRVQFVRRNLNFRADAGSPEARAMTKSFTDAILSSAKIQSKPHPERKSILLDLSEILLASDLHGIGQFLKQVWRTPYQFDKENSGFVMVKSFPLNSELGTQVRFTSPEFTPENSGALPDPRYVNLRFRYSLVAMPQNDYLPRLADDRVGHFVTVYQDYSNQGAEVPYTRLVQRWKLVKKDPKAAVSEPVEPIVFWLENTIPVEYRNDFRDGVLLWNRAFEKAGFKNALVVKQMPDDADWDPADIRYNTIRWFAGYDASFAIGPSHTNPLTGQLIDADIGMSDAIVRFLRAEYREFVQPVQRWEDVEAWLEGDALPQLPWRRDPSRLCNFGAQAAPRVAFGYEALRAQGAMTSDREKQYIREWILELTAHEVGHTLGLRHNFRGSQVNTTAQLHDQKRTGQVGIAASVMEYDPANVAPKGEPQGNYFMTNIGSYDEWAIEYAYKPVPGAKTPQDELPELRKIASRVADPTVPYNTDEDAGFGPRAVDPTTTHWDLGSDNLVWFNRQINLVRDLFAHMENKLEKPGENYEILRRSFNRMQGEYSVIGLGASKYIGGLYINRDHVGDPNGRPPFVPVPAEKQREALKFLADKVWAPDAFQVQAQLLNKLALKRFWDFDFQIFTTPRLDYPLHAVVLNLQSAPLVRLYHPITLSRLQDSEARFPAGAERFTLADMFVGIRGALWSELDSGAAINSFRRNLQRAHLNQLIQLAVAAPAGTPEDAVTLARADLVELGGKIDRALGAGNLDHTNRAHLEESRARIRQALEAQLNRTLR